MKKTRDGRAPPSRSARLGAFAAWLILITAGYSSLQFADRHVFHLQIVPIFGLLVTASVAMHWAWFDRRAVQRFAVALAMLALAVVVSFTHGRKSA